MLRVKFFGDRPGDGSPVRGDDPGEPVFWGDQAGGSGPPGRPPRGDPVSRFLVDAIVMKLLRSLALCLLIMLPAAIPYAVHALADRDGRGPTGFILLDMPGYMAKAREYVDDGIHWSYGNPSDPDPDSPRIYFQVWTLGLGLLLHATGWDPGALFVGFGVVAGLAFAWSIVRLYREAIGLDSPAHWYGLIAFAWGGGLLILCGFVRAIVVGEPVGWPSVLALDPFAGWWFLNLGRNFVLPTEAFYHALFLSTIVAVLNRQHRLAVILALLTAACHPFTSMELTAILWAWLVVEVGFLRNRERLGGLLVGISVVLAAVVAYYLVFLDRFEAHRIVAEQYALDWTLEAKHFVPAYALVGGLALWRMRTIDRAAVVLSDPKNRLFLVWFVVAFALANHEFAIEPKQPLHFTRGYIWTPLFLLGAPVLIDGFSTLLRRSKPVGRLVILGILVVFLSDNAAWLLSFPTSAAAGADPVGVRITARQREALEAIDSPSYRGHLLLCDDARLSYLALAYTPVRSWFGHDFETPEPETRLAELRALFSNGRFLPEWERTPLVVILTAQGMTEPPPWLSSRGGELVFANPSYRVYRVPPRIVSN